MQVYECEAYYYLFLAEFADALSTIHPEAGAKLKAEVDAYRKDLLAAVDRSIALSPVVPVRDGTYHSVIPFACYVRGLSTGGWGWRRDGSGAHVGPLYWETVQTAAPLISPAGLLSPKDVRVQGYLDVLEDRLLLENANVGNRPWFDAGWQYQGGLERTANMHLAADDVPAVSPLVPQLLRRRYPAERRVHLQRARRPRSARQDLRGSRVPRTVPQHARDGAGRFALDHPGRAAGMARTGTEDQREERPDPFRNVVLRNRVGRRIVAGSARRSRCRLAIRRNPFYCGCVIRKKHR